MNRGSHFKPILPVICSMLLFPSHCLPQTDTSQISGYVKDQSGGTVPGATVRVQNEATHIEHAANTDTSGYYVVSNLPSGYYTLTIEAKGFKRLIKTQNKLDADLDSRVDGVLDIGDAAESVQVTADMPPLQSENATVGKLVETAQIQNMMLNGRDPTMLVQLEPGVRSSTPLSGFNFDVGTGMIFNINGARSVDTFLSFDGAVGVRSRANGKVIGIPDVDSVQEVQILTSSFNAEYGRSMGGEVRIISKSGTNQFHGSGYEYVRNTALDANTWANNRTNQPTPTDHFNQYGYSIGGPVYIPGKWNTERNKLFFFWGNEYTGYHPEATSIITVPTSAMRTGDFSALLAPNPFFNSVRIVKDPNTGTAFPNNVIPASRLSPNGIAFLNMYPLPKPGFNQGSSNYIQELPNPSDISKQTLTSDFLPKAKHVIAIRYKHYNETTTNAFNSVTSINPTIIKRPQFSASLSYTWIVSPTLINEATGTASDDRVLYYEVQNGLYPRSKYGINYPYLIPTGKDQYDKIPTVDITNFAEVTGAYLGHSSGPVYTFSDNLTKIVDRHSFKFGVYYERTGEDDYQQVNNNFVPGGTSNQNGRFIFSDSRLGAPSTGLAIGNAALGLFDTYAELGPLAYTPYRSNMVEMFAQDAWKVNQRLSLNLGVRYSLMQPYYYSLWGNIAEFSPQAYNPSQAVVQDPHTGYILSGNPLNGVVIPGSGWPQAAIGRVSIASTGQYNNLFTGGSNTWGQLQKLNIQPRIGVAYLLTQKIVIRSGFGGYNARPGVSDTNFLGGNPPFQQQVSVATGSADNPAGGAQSAFPLFLSATDPVYKNPHSYEWNGTVQAQLPFKSVLEVAYVGRLGLHLERTRDLDQLAVGTLTNPANAGINVNVLRPYKGYAGINLQENAARSRYNALEVQFSRRFSHGLSFGFAYTLSRSMDNASGYNSVVYNSYNDRNYWGLSDFNETHVGVINFIYELPFFKNARSGYRVLGGWQVSGVIQFQTGTPITVGTNNDYAGIGTTYLQPWEVTGTPSTANAKFSNGAGDQNYYFNAKNANGAALFGPPAAGTFSQTQNRNSLPIANPDTQSWNSALFKEFKVRERLQFQFRSEFFNFLNHPNWSNPDTNPLDSTFGKVTGKNGQRSIQLSLRARF